MTTEVIREAGQYQLVNAGIGASGLFAVFCTKTEVITDWDSDEQWVHYMRGLDLDDFEAECETLIEAERENWEECVYCEDVVPECEYNSEYYEGSTCCSDCHNDMIYLMRYNHGDPNYEHRTY